MATGLRWWTISLVLVSATIGATILAVASFFPGETYSDRLSEAYQVLIDNTTRRQFTDIMRDDYRLEAGDNVPVGIGGFEIRMDRPKREMQHVVNHEPR